jgi:hypothetical protein
MLDSREGAAIIEDPGGVETALSLYSKPDEPKGWQLAFLSLSPAR